MDSKTYERAIEYGFSAIPEHELTEKVRLEDEKRFREELKQITFLCPECDKIHSLNENAVNSLVKASLSKTLGKVSFQSVCVESDVRLRLEVNARTNGFATPIYNIKKENVKIEAISLKTLAFEREDFKKLTEKQLKQIIAYHENHKNPYSENVVSRALEELQIRELEASKLQIETKETERKKPGLFSKISIGIKNMFK